MCITHTSHPAPMLMLSLSVSVVDTMTRLAGSDRVLLGRSDLLWRCGDGTLLNCSYSGAQIIVVHAFVYAYWFFAGVFIQSNIQYKEHITKLAKNYIAHKGQTLIYLRVLWALIICHFAVMIISHKRPIEHFLWPEIRSGTFISLCKSLFQVTENYCRFC